MTYKKAPLDPILLGTFYSKLEQIFWISKNYLFHAYCLHKYYKLSVESNINQTDLEHLRRACVLAALSILPDSRHDMLVPAMTPKDRENLKLAQTLGFDCLPKRSSLFDLLIAEKLIDKNDKTSLYYLLELEFDPSGLSKKVYPMIESLKLDELLSKYSVPITNAVISCVAHQCSRLYENIKISSFERFLPNNMKFDEVESVLMENVQVHQLSIKVDHVNGVIFFKDSRMDSYQMRSQLTDLSKGLAQVFEKIFPILEGEQNHHKRKEQRRLDIYERVRSGLLHERNDVFNKMDLIEQRKRTAEDNKIVENRMVEHRKKEIESKRQEDERERLKKLNEQRERDRQAREERDLREKYHQKQLEDIAKSEKEMQQKQA